MQAHEHIWTILAMNASKGKTKGEAIEILKEYVAYATLTDSIRCEINPTPDGRLKAYRPLSHYTDGAWMELPFGEALKNFKGLENTKYYVPQDAVRKAADGPTDIGKFVNHNQAFLKDKHSAFTLVHLLQDVASDRIMQEDIATTYYNADAGQSEDKLMQFYGLDTKDGLCKFNKTGKVTDMGNFRNLVTLFSVLTSTRLWKNIKEKYPDLTIDEVADATKEAYERDYSENMAKQASQYVRPNPVCEQLIEMGTLDEQIQIAGVNIQSVKDIKSGLLELGAFNNEKEIEEMVGKAIKECVEIFNESGVFVNKEDGKITENDVSR